MTRIVFPTYFTTNTYFLGIYNNYSLSFSIRQFSYIFFSYILLFIIFSIGVIVHFYVSELKCFLSNKFALSQGIGMFFVGVWLSTSDGAWITYYLQLFLPFIIFAGVVSWEELRNILLVTRKDNIHHICLSLLELVMFFFLMFSIKGYLLIDRIGKEYVDQWEEMYGVLDSYTGKNMKVSALPLTFYCIKNNIYCDNPGHSNCYTYELLDMVYNEKSWKILFPFAKELTEQYLSYYEDTLQKCSEGYYDCIILQESDYWKEKTEIAMGSMYKKYGEYTLKCGTEDWVCIVYIKK